MQVPPVLVTDSWNCEVGGQEPWPKDVKLFQPYEAEQILLPDHANCLAVQAFLRMCNLPYSNEYRANAEYMSPSGRVPFIKCGSFIVSDLEPIVSFVCNKGKSLTDHLSSTQKSDMRAYMSLISVLGNAESYITWCDDQTYSLITKTRYGSVHPFPLNHILCYLKRKSVIKRLTAYKWAEKKLEMVYEEVDRCCRSLSERLGSNKYFFGDKFCELDALLFGHVYSVLTWRGLSAGLGLANKLRAYPSLVHLCQNVAPLLGLSPAISTPSPHRLLSQSALPAPPAQDDIDTFVYSDEECNPEEEDEPDSDAVLGFISNDQNVIHESLFSE